ncbi:MAG: hypothetical protein ACE5FA_01060 [Dehalococcoidia bacterium]
MKMHATDWIMMISILIVGGFGLYDAFASSADQELEPEELLAPAPPAWWMNGEDEPPMLPSDNCVDIEDWAMIAALHSVVPNDDTVRTIYSNGDSIRTVQADETGVILFDADHPGRFEFVPGGLAPPPDPPDSVLAVTVTAPYRCDVVAIRTAKSTMGWLGSTDKLTALSHEFVARCETGDQRRAYFRIDAGYSYHIYYFPLESTPVVRTEIVTP